MTHSGGKPHAVGYSGQRLRIVVDEVVEGRMFTRRIAWTNSDTQDLASLNTRPGWSRRRTWPP